MRDRGHTRVGLRVLIVVALLALACRAGLAQIGPRYVIDATPAAPGAHAAGAAASAGQQGRVLLAGKGMALVRVLGVDVLVLSADAEAYNVDELGAWPAADLLLLTPASAGRYEGLAPLSPLRGMPVVVAEPGGAVLIGPGGDVLSASASAAASASPSATATATATAAVGDRPRIYPLQTWDALHLRKGKTQLRVTALPGQAGTSGVAGFMLDAGNSRISYRVYVSCAALEAGEAAMLPQRVPGADLALLPGHNPPHVLPLLRDADVRASRKGKGVDAERHDDAGAQPVALTAAGQLLQPRRH